VGLPVIEGKTQNAGEKNFYRVGKIFGSSKLFNHTFELTADEIFIFLHPDKTAFRSIKSINLDDSWFCFDFA
jgi:hypothetical protein